MLVSLCVCMSVCLYVYGVRFEALIASPRGGAQDTKSTLLFFSCLDYLFA